MKKIKINEKFNLFQITADEGKAIKIVTLNEDGIKHISYGSSACGKESFVNTCVEVPIAEREAWEAERKRMEEEMSQQEEE